MFILDIIFIIPLNILIFLRNLFPGRWKYKSFSWKYIKYVVLWVWRGEISAASIFIRYITITLLRFHFSRRFLRLKLFLDLDTGIPKDKKGDIMSEIDTYLNRWNFSKSVSSIF